VEIIGRAGWDFTVIDCEHAPISVSLLPDMLRAADAVGLPAIVRVPENNAAAIQHALDSGAAGVMVPQISSLEAAQRAIAAARFHPLGTRGVNPFVRAAQYSAKPAADFLGEANESTLLVLQIESADGVRVAPEIAKLSGVDVLFVGPYDLSQSIGIPGAVDDERVLRLGSELIAAAQTAGVHIGVFVNSDEAAVRWHRLGVRFLAWSVDTVQLLQALRTARTRIADQLR
jgi:4-hydroxy-2-oxoheptanedioate aldolase